MPETRTSLDSRILANGLVSADDLAKCRKIVGEASDEAHLLDLLTTTGRLTKWQAAQLQSDKSKGFVLGHYKLLEPLGAGGMGQVFRALDAELNQQFAIKVLPRKSKTPEAVQRFRREGMAALQVHHEHIVRTYELAEHGDTHYLVMELIEGTTLAKYIEKQKVLSPREAARIGQEVCEALEHARRHGIIHRDIKPSNILLTRQAQVKVADLGLAKFFAVGDDRPSTLTHSGAFMGTVDYCAPEQAEDAKRADTRSDIYSLGCTLYQCLTGRVPFPRGTNVQKIVAHREHEPEPIRVLNDAVPQLLADLITKRMLAKRPEERFQTPAEAATVLEAWANGDATPRDAAYLTDLSADDYVPAGTDLADPTVLGRPSRGSDTLRQPSFERPSIGRERRARSSPVARFMRGMSAGRIVRFVVVVGILGSLWWAWRHDVLQQILSRTVPETTPINNPVDTVAQQEPVPPPPDTTVERAVAMADRDLDAAINLLRQRLAVAPDDQKAKLHLEEFKKRQDQQFSVAREEAKKMLAEAPRSRGFSFSSLRDVDGELHSWSDYAGKILIVNVAATWCPYTQCQAPHLAALHNKYRDQGVAVIGIHHEELVLPGRSPPSDVLATIRAYRSRHGISFPCLVGDEATKQAIGYSANSFAFPLTLCLDRTGAVRIRRKAAWDRVQLEAVVSVLLEESQETPGSAMRSAGSEKPEESPRGKETPNLEKFAGKWVGKWDNIYRVEFTITVNPDGTASALYEWDETGKGPLRSQTLSVKLENKTLKVGKYTEITLVADVPNQATAIGRFPRNTRVASLSRPATPR